MDKNSVLLVIDSLANGGAQKQLSILASSLSKKNLNVYVAFYKTHSLYFEDSILSSGGHCLPFVEREGGSRWEFVSFLRSIIKTNNIVTIVSFLDTPAIYCALALVGRLDKKFIVCKRNYSKYKNTSFVGSFLDRFAIFMASKVVANSYAESNFLINSFYCTQKKIVTIWNGFEPHSVSVNSSAAKFKKVLVVARVTEQKNVLSTIKAIARLNEHKDTAVELHWAGRFDCSQDYEDKINDILKSTQLGDGWRWLGQVDDISKLYSEYDALLLPSLFEGLPNALCEAMSAGLPVITTDVCDNSRLIGDEERGVLAWGTDEESIATALIHFYKLTNQERKTMVINAKNFVSEKLSVQKMTRAYTRLIE